MHVAWVNAKKDIYAICLHPSVRLNLSYPAGTNLCVGVVMDHDQNVSSE
jgi:hypothetical protein